MQCGGRETQNKSDLTAIGTNLNINNERQDCEIGTVCSGEYRDE
jgi:hypothetical protein